MKLLLFLATKKGYEVLKILLEDGMKESIGGVVTFKEVNVDTSYHSFLEEICIKNSVPFFYWSQVKDNLQVLLEKYMISGAIAISWIYLLDMKYFEGLQHSLIIFHDSLLPKYRGFAPTSTAIICGETLIGITALFASDKVDEGDIILQRSMEIGQDEYINEIIDRQAKLYASMVLDIFKNLGTENLSIRKQNHDEATYSIWRSPEDCRISWGNSSIRIYNLIRAVGKPYSGAFTYMNNKKIIINKAEILPEIKFIIRDHGKVWRIENGHPDVVCGIGMLKIKEAVYEDGTIVEFRKTRIQFT